MLHDTAISNSSGPRDLNRARQACVGLLGPQGLQGLSGPQGRPLFGAASAGFFLPTSFGRRSGPPRGPSCLLPPCPAHILKLRRWFFAAIGTRLPSTSSRPAVSLKVNLLPMAPLSGIDMGSFCASAGRMWKGAGCQKPADHNAKRLWTTMPLGDERCMLYFAGVTLHGSKFQISPRQGLSETNSRTLVVHGS